MSTVRRLYFYGLALISIDVVIWGVINLVRTIFSRGLIGGGSLLATGLSLVLVGVPIFFLHWRTVQRDAAREPEERASRIRAVFFYAALMAILLPIVYALLALIDRGLVVLFGQSASSAWFGGDGTARDNLIAIVINAVALAYFWKALREDWLVNTPENYLADTSRLYRYLWVLFGLILTVSGVFNVLRYLFYTPGQTSVQTVQMLAGGISLLVCGTPLWAYHWRKAQASLTDPAEKRSLLRLVVLYLITLAGVIGVLSVVGSLLNGVFRWILGAPNTLFGFLHDNSAQLGAAIPLAVMWWYYGNILNNEVANMPDQPRRAALRRLYDYILSLLGLIVTFGGLVALVEFIAELAFSISGFIGSTRNLISGALAALLVGMPLWLLTWREMQREAARLDEPGDHARRSVLRKAYLYLVLFLLVIAVMGFAGALLFTLFNTLLTGVEADLGLSLTKMILNLIIAATLLVYHFRALRQDGRVAQLTLGDLHAAFPTLVLVEENNEFVRQFADSLVQILARVTPRLPVAIHPMERGAPDEPMLGAKAIILSFGLALNPPESLRLWLQEYHGRRIITPLPQEGWFWLGQADKSAQDMARETAQAVRQIAEGEAVRQAPTNNPWSIVGYVFGAIFGLIILLVLFSVIVSSLFG